MRNAKVLIVVTTLDVPHGLIPGHTQDPLSRAEFRAWFLSDEGEIVAHERFAAGRVGWRNGTVVSTANQIAVWRRNTR